MEPDTPVDLRTEVHDLIALTPEIRLRLAGLACARCGSTEALRPGGHAYTHSTTGGQLGWAVKVCANCPVHLPQERELRS